VIEHRPQCTICNEPKKSREERGRLIWWLPGCLSHELIKQQDTDLHRSQRSISFDGLEAFSRSASRGVSVSTVNRALKPLPKRSFNQINKALLITPLVASGDASCHLGQRRRRFSDTSRAKIIILTMKLARKRRAKVWLSGMKNKVRTRAVSSRIEIPR
jgi:hypothetical protein